MADPTWENPVVDEVSKVADGAVVTDTTKTPATEPVKPEGDAAGKAVTPDPDAPPDLDKLLKDEETAAKATLDTLGITPESAPGILQKAKNFDATVDLMLNNPNLLLDELEKMDPGAAKRLLDKATDRYIERYGDKDSETDRTAGDKSKELSPDAKKLLTRLEKLETERNAERDADAKRSQAAQGQAIQAALDKKVEAIFEKVPQLAKADRKGVRSLIMDSLGANKEDVAQIVNGNLSVVSKHAKAILEEHFKDRKAEIDAQKEARSKVTDKAQTNVAAGAAPAAGEQKGADWESAIQGVASALSKAKK